MHVRDYLAENAARKASTHESEGLDLAEVSISSGKMSIADPTLYPDGLVVCVCPGLHHIQVVILTESGYRVVARLRAFSTKDHVVGESVGEVSVDFARLGIGDDTQISAVSNAITPEMAEPIWQSLETDALFGVVPWNVEAGVEMPFVTPGDGDGRYEVRELLHGQDRVGVQIEFVPERE